MAQIQLALDRARWALQERIQRFGGEAGAGLVEYALLTALIALVCFAALTFFGEATSSKMSLNASCFDGGCQ